MGYTKSAMMQIVQSVLLPWKLGHGNRIFKVLFAKYSENRLAWEGRGS